MRPTLSKRVRSAACILLVDDNRDGVLARRSVLEELGYQVVPAHSVAEALACVDKQSFDLIITDYKMPPSDGLELISTLRGRGMQVPIVLLTGFADSLGLRAESTGADVVMQKSSNEIPNLLRHAKRLLTPPKKPAGTQPVGEPSAKAKARTQGRS